MNCPHCGKQLEFIAPVFRNCAAYGGYPKGKTTCCGKLVGIRRIISYVASIPEDVETYKIDDWGNRLDNHTKCECAHSGSCRYEVVVVESGELCRHKE